MFSKRQPSFDYDFFHSIDPPLEAVFEYIIRHQGKFVK
jgi:hypothetical protein